MITKLSIKRFGIFKDFTWNANIPDFRKHNVLYGWNYSGKTTLSRIFRSFEVGEAHSDFPNAEFSLVSDSESTFNQDDVPSGKFPPVRVFNSDFVRENLRTFAGDDPFDPVLLLGIENVDLQAQLKSQRAKLAKTQEHKEKCTEDLRKAGQKLEESLTDKAREIKNILSIPEFDRPKLQPHVTAVQLNPQQYRLDEANLKKTLAAHGRTDAMAKLQLPRLPMPIIGQLVDNVRELSGRSISAAKLISELEKDHELSTWVDQGRPLHRQRRNCGFCGQRLPSDRLQELDKHFTKEYDRLQQDIETTRNSIQAHAKDIARFSLPAKTGLYAELRDEYHRWDGAFSTSRKAYQDLLRDLESALGEKKARPFEVLQPKLPADPTPDLQASVKEISDLVTDHNNKTDNFEKERSAARDMLLKHGAAEFVIDKKYDQMVAEIQSLKRRLPRFETVADRRESKIRELEKQLSETVRGAEKVNQYIQLLTGRNEISVEVTPDGKFRLMRGEDPARNLSEGEKTAVALAYFVARLEDRGTVLSDTIVFIDDPVSSFDHNHLFAAYAFIKDKLGDCSQLFVATHNIDFFNLMKDFCDEAAGPDGKRLYTRDQDKNKLPCYLVQRERNTSVDRGIICDAPRLLKKFKSEYIYLFSLLHHFGIRPDGADYEMLYLVPNILRRFLESYTGFRLPGRHKLDERYGQLLPDEQQRSRVLKLINEYSHVQSVDRAFKFPEAAECKEVVALALGALETHDPDHYQSLCDACT